MGEWFDTPETRAPESIQSLALWARTEASRMIDMQWEWLAAGVAFVSLYLSWVVAPRGQITVTDAFSLLFAAGSAIAASRFSRRSAAALDDFASRVAVSGGSDQPPPHPVSAYTTGLRQINLRDDDESDSTDRGER